MRRSWQYGREHRLQREAAGFEILEQATPPGCNPIRIGSEFSIPWEGRFTVHRIEKEPQGAIVILAYGGDRNPEGRRAWRSFDLDRIKRVHHEGKRPKG